MGNSSTHSTTNLSVSKFYLACRSGNVDVVKQVLPTMKLKEINRIESNGSTSLHAAAWYGHFEIVELLLKYGCSTTTTNKYGKTALQECKDERIRKLIQSPEVATDNGKEETDHAPKSQWFQLYENIDNQDKSVVATKVMKLRLKTYLTNQFKTNARNRTDHIREIVLQNVPPSNSEYDSILELLKKFEITKEPQFLLTIYTSETPFYGYLQYNNQDEVFIMELLISLMVFTQRFFCGYTYRGTYLSKTELDCYLWAYQHHASFIEMRSITSTSASRSIAEKFAQRQPFKENTFSTLIILHFAEPCETAVDLRRISDSLPGLSAYEYEEEILIIPGTFFEVTSINQSSDCTIIALKNVPVSRSILIKTINELK